MRSRIEHEFAGKPRVRVEISDPAQVSAPIAPGLAAAPERPSAGAFEKQFPTRDAFEQFSHEMLSWVEQLLARVHALRRLAGRFPREVEQALGEGERTMLASLRREHAAEVARLARELQGRTRPVLDGMGIAPAGPVASPPGAGDWQTAAEELLGAARAAETALADMLGVTESSASVEETAARVEREFARLSTRAGAYSSLR
jgi:hypothetical protein